jgi:hypothetical protein
MKNEMRAGWLLLDWGINKVSIIFARGGGGAAARRGRRRCVGKKKYLESAMKRSKELRISSVWRLGIG